MKQRCFLALFLLYIPIFLYSQRVINNPLYGKKYAKTTVVSQELKGAVFYLSSGHGGPDPGAIGKSGRYSLHEDEYAYDITLRLARTLESRGAKVYMIIQDAKDGIRDAQYLKNSKIETCMGLTIPLNQIKRLRQRSEKINNLFHNDKSRYKRGVYVHVDSRSISKQMDVFFYHCPKSIAGQRTAQFLCNTMRDQYKEHQPTRGFGGTVSERSLHMLTQTTPVGVFIELGNIANSADQRRLVVENNRQALANWLADGFTKEYNTLK